MPTATTIFYQHYRISLLPRVPDLFLYSVLLHLVYNYRVLFLKHTSYDKESCEQQDLDGLL